MVLEEERLVRLRQQLSKEAIDLAMQGKWREAISVNDSIIANFPRDVEAYNRLGRAYLELGEYTQAREAYSHSAELDSFNAIAKKNLQRLNYLKETANAERESDGVQPRHFIEEIGKSGVVNLYGAVPKERLAKMVSGDKVFLKVDGINLSVENGQGDYLGQVDPRHAQRLAKLMQGGNQYSATVVSSTEDMIAIIIREEYQDPSQIGRLSFPPKGREDVHTSVTDRLIKVGLEEEEADSGYTIIGGEEIEVMPDESIDSDDIDSDEV